MQVPRKAQPVIQIPQVMAVGILAKGSRKTTAYYTGTQIQCYKVIKAFAVNLESQMFVFKNLLPPPPTSR